MSNIKKYLKMDCYRLFSSVYTLFFPLLFAVIILLCGYVSSSALGVIKLDTFGTIDLLQNSLGSDLFFVSFVMVVALYSNTLREDMQRKADCQYILRGDYKSYIISKVLVNNLAAILLTVTGGMLFCVLWSAKYGWITDCNLIKSCISLEVPFSELLQDHQYFSYCFLVFLSFGFLGSFMSQIGMFVSFFFAEKTMILVFPIFTMYFIEYVQSIFFPFKMNIFHVFNPMINYGDVGCGLIIPPILYVVFISIIEIVLLCVLYRRKRLC